jgi:hypothetical protein
VDEHPLAVTAAELSGNKSLRLTVPELQPAMSIEIVCRLKQADGTESERVIHGTVHLVAGE